LLWVHQKPNTLVGCEPAPSVSKANAMSTAPRRRARTTF
jgi:hypothetical protein